MLAFSERLIFEYKPIVMKMSEDLPINLIVAINYELFCDVETMMGLTSMLPKLEVVQNLSKPTQNIICFNCDFLVVVKLIQGDLYILYVDLECHFSYDQFQHFVDLVEFKFDTLSIVWCVRPTTQMDYDAFCFKK
jgi:hypothetical protein